MTTSTTAAKTSPTGLATRVLSEGYGPGAWHGADLKAALADVTPAVAFWRPAPGRHDIAEIAMHHAYCVHSVHARLSGATPEPFVLEGDDWFALEGEARLTWPRIQEIVRTEQERLAARVADLESGAATSPLSEAERFDLVLGITCHAVYHAGQIQLLKRLQA